MAAILQEPLILWSLRVFLAALFATAAISKLTAVDEFHGVIRNFRLLPEGLTRPVALTLPLVELAVAAGLVATPTAAPAALAAAGLLAIFGLAIAVNVRRGRTSIDCGCFRNGMKQRIGWRMVLRNAGLTALALGLAALLPGARAAAAADLATGALAGLVLALLYFSASFLGGLADRRHATPSMKGR